MNEKNCLIVKNLSKIYTGGYYGVSEVSFEIPHGGRLIIFGEEGSGKSTLLRLISGLENKDAGEILIDGNDFFLKSLKERDVVASLSIKSFKKGKTVFDNLTFPLKLRNYSPEKIADRFLYVAKTLDIMHLADRKISKLSESEFAKVSLARVFMRDAQIVLLDEPFEGITVEAREKVFSALQNLLKNCKGCVIIALSNKNELEKFENGKTVFLHSNMQIQYDTLINVIKHPNTCGLAKIVDETLHFSEVELLLKDGKVYAEADGVRKVLSVKLISDIYDKTKVLFASKKVFNEYSEGEVCNIYDIYSEQIVGKFF